MEKATTSEQVPRNRAKPNGGVAAICQHPRKQYACVMLWEHQPSLSQERVRYMMGFRKTALGVYHTYCTMVSCSHKIQTKHPDASETEYKRSFHHNQTRTHPNLLSSSSPFSRRAAFPALSLRPPPLSRAAWLESA